jgi:hypothetical protein
MLCPDCRAECVAEDIYCRHCGSDLTNVAASTSLVPAQRLLPAVFQHPRLPKTVAASVGALVLGVGLELLRRGFLARFFARSAAPAAGSLLPKVMQDLLPQQRQEKVRLKKGYEIQEIVYMRRIVRR